MTSSINSIFGQTDPNGKSAFSSLSRDFTNTLNQMNDGSSDSNSHPSNQSLTNTQQ
jgi:hypothetical protein